MGIPHQWEFRVRCTVKGCQNWQCTSLDSPLCHPHTLLAWIDELSINEGDSMTINYHNPDGEPKLLITFEIDFGFNDQDYRIPGKSLEDCLQQAVIDKRKIKGT